MKTTREEEMPEKKILISASTFPKNPGDVSTARFVLDLAGALTGYYEVHVLTPHSHGALKEECFGDIKVHRFKYFFPEKLQKLTQEAGITPNLQKNKFLLFQLPFLFISEIAATARIIRREKINTVNSHWIVPQGLATAIIANLLKINHVITAHGTDVFTLKKWGKLGKHIATYAINRADAVMPVSSYLKKTLDEVAGRKYRFEIAPMGIKGDRFNPEKRGGDRTGGPDCLRLLFVGKLVEIKGARYLLEAVNILKERGTRVELTIIGRGPREDELKNYALEKDLSGQVDFLGWMHNEKLPDFYAASDITVVPSHDKTGDVEGMPVVILESFAAGTPVLASRISGIPDVVKDGLNGWLVQSGSGKALADKIGELNSADLKKFSEAALQTAKKYTCQSIAKKYREIIESLS